MNEEQQVCLLWHDGYRWYSSGPMEKEWAIRARALLLPRYPRMIVDIASPPHVASEDLGFVLYRSRPVTLEQRCRRRARWLTSRWLYRYRQLPAYIQQQSAVYLTAAGGDNWITKNEEPCGG